MKKIIVAIAAIGLMVSCTSTQSVSQKQSAKQVNANEVFIEGNQWQLTTFKGQSAEEAGFNQRQAILVINMAEQKVGGNSGCNSFGGEVVVEGDIATFSKVFSTKMYCDGVPEHEFFQILQQPLKYTIEGDVLKFEKDGEVLLTYKLVTSDNK